jgi:hypothetical protein
MKRIMFPREVLLVEVERRCAGEACGARARVALTKEEARSYAGFECGRCGRWNRDALGERDIPEWWEELKITALDGLRPVGAAGGGPEDEETPDAVWRLSEAWGRLRAAGDGEDEGEAGS